MVEFRHSHLEYLCHRLSFGEIDEVVLDVIGSGFVDRVDA